jgi:hypothetical protein
MENAGVRAQVVLEHPGAGSIILEQEQPGQIILEQPCPGSIILEQPEPRQIILSLANTVSAGLPEHSPTHAIGGSDALSPSDIGAEVSGAAAAVQFYVESNYAKPFEYIQSLPSATWILNHNLGYRPSVTVFSIGFQEIDAEVVNTSVNQTVISFTVAIAGIARLN